MNRRKFYRKDRTQQSTLSELSMSFAQTGIWALDQWESGNITYNRTTAFRINGPLDVKLLERSLNAIVRRHEILRTTFISNDGQPIQVISQKLTLALPIINLGELESVKREHESLRLIVEENRKVFDLARGPLLRVTLLRLEDQEYIFLLTVHNIVFDEWSSDIFYREISFFYKTLSTGELYSLLELPIQYSDFTLRQRDWLCSDLSDKQLHYWKKQLTNSPRFLSLPTIQPRPLDLTNRGACHTLRIPEHLTQELKDLGRKEDASLFMIMLAAMKVMLYRYSGQEDIVVGCPVSNRNHPELENLIGLFLNMLLLRTDLSGNPTFRTLLERVREVCLEAFSHQDLPFEKVVEEMAKRQLGHPPLVQVVFVFQNVPVSPLVLPGLDVGPIKVESNTAKVDLSILVVKENEGLDVTLQYRTDLFDEATIIRMAGHYHTLLKSIVEHTDCRLSKMPLLTESEQNQILFEWNDTQVVYPRDMCLHRMFEAQVEETPDNVALAFKGRKLTYRELNESANRLAHYLKKCGIAQDTLVGIRIERSLEMIIGLLGILKAGGAYVPIDPDYPQQRQEFILSDSQISVLVTMQKLAVVGLPDQNLQTVFLDADWPAISKENHENPCMLEIAPESLAYVIYTSGSTGKPKGVLAAHKGVCNVICSLIQSYGIKPGSRTLFFVSLSFDAATAHIFYTLCAGATLYITDPKSILETLREEAITQASFPVPVLAALPRDALSGLQILSFGAEACTLELISRWSQGRRLFNAYGPTETTICSTLAEYTDGSQSPHIGRPIANTQIYILDRNLQPLPVGIIGEIYIGGFGVARGYLNRPALTAEKFIRDPFNPDPGGRLYRTGDLAFYRSDSKIEFVGRIDHQVKIRGFRIELGEIEATLARHPEIRETVVADRVNTSGDKHLVAYFVPHEEKTLEIGNLCNYLKNKLPEHMVPSHYVTLETLPLTPNGKVDREALPAPDPVVSKGKRPFVAPEQKVEKLLASIWSKVFGIDQISIHDNYFELGGDSLMAVRLFSQIEKVFHRRLPLATLIHAPTIAQLVGLFSDEGWSPPWSSLVSIQSSGTKPPFFFVHAHEGNVLGYYDLARHLGKDQPFYGLQARGLNTDQPAVCKMREIAANYISEIQTVQPHGPYLLGGWCFGGTAAYEMAQQLQARGEPIDLLVMIQNPHPDYPRFLPGVTKAHCLLYRFVDRIGLELDNVIKVKPNARLQHLSGRAKRVLTIMQVQTEGVATAWLARFNMARNNSRAYALHLLGEAHIEAMRSYRPRPYHGPTLLFHAAQQPKGIYPDPSLGWRHSIDEQLECVQVPGHRLGILTEPHVRIVAKVLRERFDSLE